MKRLSVFVLLAITLNVALGRSFRHKRQSSDEDENALDNRYGWEGPSWGWVQPDTGNARPVNPPRNIVIDAPQPTPAPTVGTTTLSSAIQACMRNCPVTSEYNPVCGTNMVQYRNPGLLGCAQACGVNVTLLRASRCPPASTTPAP